MVRIGPAAELVQPSMRPRLEPPDASDRYFQQRDDTVRVEKSLIRIIRSDKVSITEPSQAPKEYLAPRLPGVELSLLGGGQCTTPLRSPGYRLRELAAFERPAGTIVPADRPHAIVALDDCFFG
jgi:hypothetical protein